MDILSRGVNCDNGVLTDDGSKWRTGGFYISDLSISSCTSGISDASRMISRVRRFKVYSTSSRRYLSLGSIRTKRIRNWHAQVHIHVYQDTETQKTTS